VTSTRPRQPVSGALGDGISGLRIAVLGDYFARGATAEALAAVEALAEALGADARVSFPEAARARSAAMVITAAEGAQNHLHDLRTRAAEFDPMTRDRFLAGAMIPASAYVSAQRFRRWFRGAVAGAMASADIVLAPTTPFPAPLIGQREAVVDGETVLTQPYLGCFTQPLSFVGLPVLTVPAGRSGDGLPLGVQLVAAPYREEALVRLAAELERQGLAAVAAVGAPA
jgi:Asp-tRNA(Asn)/Glu-tRNA(Gln) amidotransferase A subunit family amidase